MHFAKTLITTVKGNDYIIVVCQHILIRSAVLATLLCFRCILYDNDNDNNIFFI